MALRKKRSVASRGAEAALKAAAAAEKTTMKAFADWRKAVDQALSTAEKEVKAAAKTVGTMEKRAEKEARRVAKATTTPAKRLARDARKRVQKELVAARATLTGLRRSHAMSKAAKRLVHRVEKSMSRNAKHAGRAIRSATRKFT
jgi:hypothetical protein